MLPFWHEINWAQEEVAKPTLKGIFNVFASCMAPITNSYSGINVTFQVTNPVNHENQQNFHSISLLLKKGNKSFSRSLADF